MEIINLHPYFRRFAGIPACPWKALRDIWDLYLLRENTISDTGREILNALTTNPTKNGESSPNKIAPCRMPKPDYN